MSKFTQEQRAAIDAQGRTIVSASAGSGKTTVMIQKMIELICVEKVDVTRILAVTYTKKAAASMKDKLRKALIKAVNDPNTSREDKERLKAQYRLVPLADISTIHSFCGKLIRTHFYATDVGNKFGIIAEDDAEGTALRARAMENVFEQAYAESDEDFLALLSVYYRKKKDDTLREVISSTHTKLRTHVDYRQELAASGQDSEELFDGVCKEAYAWFVDKCKVYREELSKLYGFFERETGRDDCVKYCDALMSALNSWIDAGDLFTLAAMPWAKLPNKPKLDPELDPPDFVAAVNHLLRLQAKIKKMNDDERKAVESREVERENFSRAAALAKPLAKFVLRFDDEYMRLKKQRGVLDYNDLEHYSLALLNQEEIAAEMRNKYEYVFVDEYQDVNPVQEKIVAGVSGKNLFLVGDIKQSIYGFRGSKSKFFAEKWDEFASDPTANALKLSKNFRSVSPVLDAVNIQFERIMTKQNSEVDYRADGVMEFGGLYEEGAGRVQLHFLGKDEKEEDEVASELGIYSVQKNVALKKAVLSNKVKCIKQIIDSERMSEYFNVETGQYQRVQYSDIAILDRRKKGSIAEVIAALAAEGVPVSSETPVNICDFPEIKSLLDLLSLLDNRQQDIPLASVLLSAVGGFTEDDLVAVRLAYRGEHRDDKKVNFRTACEKYAAEKTDALAGRLNEFYTYFDGLRRFAQVHSAGEVLTKVVAEKGLEASLLAGLNGENCLKRIHRLIEETQNPSPLDVHGFLQRLKMLDFDLPYCENGGENAVHVMTMHASKGLEFPVVIATNLDRNFYGADRDEVQYVDGYGIAPRAYDLEKMTYSSTVLRLLGKRRDALESVRDALNVYYVALTRAQFSMHLLFDEVSEGADICYGKSYGDLTDFSVWEQYKTDGAGIDLPQTERQAIALEIDQALVEKIRATWAWKYAHTGCENMPAKTSPTAMMKLLAAKTPEGRTAAFVADGHDEEANADTESLLLGKTDTLVGSAYHAFLEHFDFGALRGVSEEDLPFLVEDALSTLREDESFSEYLALLEVPKLVEILKNPVFYRLGDARLYKEQRFMCALPANEVLTMLGEAGGECPTCGEDMLFQGAVDLLAVSEGGAEVIDYKYSQKGEKALRETYSMQLELYRLAMSKALKLPKEKIRCTIVNIYRGYEIEV